MEQLSEAQVFAILDREPVARLAQLDDRNRVQAIPFVFARVGRRLFSPVDGKPKRHGKLSRLAWLETHPDVTVLIDHYNDDWRTLWWLRLYGAATPVDEADADWAQAVDKLNKKYQQYEQISMFSGAPTMLCFTVDHWQAWAADAQRASLMSA